MTDDTLWVVRYKGQRIGKGDSWYLALLDAKGLPFKPFRALRAASPPHTNRVAAGDYTLTRERLVPLED